MRHSEAFVVMYGINCKWSFEDALVFFEQIERVREVEICEIPCYLVGNKCDMAPNERQVSTEEMIAAAAKLGVECAETSAKDGINVKKVMDNLAVMVLQNRAYARARKDKSRKEQKNKCIAM